MGLSTLVVAAVATLGMLAQNTPRDEAADRQKMIDWMITQRVDRENLGPERVLSLEERYKQLKPEELRVLVMVYEQTYNIPGPDIKFDESQIGETEAAREWLVAYRIVADRLTVDQARAWADQLEKMDPSQIRTLARIYQEKYAADEKRRHASPSPPPDTDAEAQERMRAAQQRLEAAQQTRQLALARSSEVRSNTKKAQQLSNAGAAKSSITVGRQLTRMQNIGDTMYQRKASRADSRFGIGGYGYGYGGYGWRY